MALSREIPGINDPTWQQIFIEDQESRHFHTSTLFDHYIITIGGSVKKGETEDISIFDIFTYQWKKALLTGFKPKYRFSQIACLFHNNKIIIHGGVIDKKISNETLVATITVENHQDISLNIEQIEVKGAGLYRRDHCAQVFGDKMFVFGGFYQGEAFNELWSFDLKDYQWTKCLQKGDVPSRRGVQGTALVGNKMYVFGGQDKSTPCIRTNSLYSLDLDKLHWTEIKCNGTLPSPRSSTGLVENQGLLYIFGGLSEIGRCDGLFSLNLETNQWEIIQAKNKYPKKRANHTMISYENGIFIIGGGEGPAEKDELADLFYLNLLSLGKEKALRVNSGGMDQLFLNNLYSDVAFLVEGKRLVAHKMLLGTRCQFFSNMFSSQMLESNQKDIEINDCKAETFKAFLKYIYCRMIDLTEELALDLLVLCNKWLFQELEEECEAYLARTLTKENVVERAQLADKLESRKLTNAVIQLLMKNLHEFEKAGTLSKIPSPIIIQVLFEFDRKLTLNKSTT